MSKYKPIINGVEIGVDTLEDLEALLKRFGKIGKREKSQHFTPAASSKSNDGGDGGSSMDRMLLRRFVEASKGGIPSKDLHVRLGANRKTLKKELENWTKRVGLWQNNFDAIFDYIIREGVRSYRLTKEAIEAGKDILASTE